MNLIESVARELVRVTKLRAHYLAIEHRAIAVAFIDASLNEACHALGSGDPVRLLAALSTLKEHQE